MIRALLFDFNGVIVDDEPIHFALFQKVLAEEGIELSKEDYYSKYLGMDDHDCFAAVFQDSGKELASTLLTEMIERKAKYYEAEIRQNPPFIPGALDFIKTVADRYYLAIVSGALRREIELLLKIGKVWELFNAVVASEDTQHGKPNPECYQKAFDNLNRDAVPNHEMLLPNECLVLEDSIWGIEAAKAAGMPCVAITSSFSEKDLPGALLYLKNFENLESKKFFEKISKIA